MRSRLTLAYVLVALSTAVASLPLYYVGFVALRVVSRGLGSPFGFLGTLVSSLSLRRLLLLLVLAALLLFAVTAAQAVVATRSVLRPVRHLAGAARRLAGGELHTRLEVRGAAELVELAGAFNDMAAALEHNVAELRHLEEQARRFAADVSHELRTPVAVMTAVTDVLDEEAAGLDGDAAQAARLVSTETRHLTRLVNDLIEVSRFDARTASLQPAEVDVAEAVRGCVRTRGWADRIEAELPAGVLAVLDPRRLDVIVANLVGNALRHGEPPVTVRLGVQRDGGAREWVWLEVADRGPGVSEEALPHVFDRFYKAQQARSRSEGSGLGLAIAWENARLHGGGLQVANRPGGGAAFTLHLPWHRPPG